MRCRSILPMLAVAMACVLLAMTARSEELKNLEITVPIQERTPEALALREDLLACRMGFRDILLVNRHLILPRTWQL